jgi:hypothetical protein
VTKICYYHKNISAKKLRKNWLFTQNTASLRMQKLDINIGFKDKRQIVTITLAPAMSYLGIRLGFEIRLM